MKAEIRDRERLEREVDELIREHVAVGYTLGGDGKCDPDTIFVLAAGAAHVIVHHLLAPIAAAPDMLAALRQIDLMARDDEHRGDDALWTTEWQNAVEDARAAIAKATER